MVQYVKQDTSNIWKTNDPGATWADTWDSGLIVEHVWDTFDLVILGSFSAFVSKLMCVILTTVFKQIGKVQGPLLLI